MQVGARMHLKMVFADPPGYANYQPSLLRLENTSKVLLANLITQPGGNPPLTKCGLFDTGFAGGLCLVMFQRMIMMLKTNLTCCPGNFYDPKSWRSILEITAERNFSTPSLEWPVVYMRGNWD